MSRNQFLLVGNGSYQNMGCEAILRGTVKILRSAFGFSEFINANFDMQNPPYVPNETDPYINNKPLSPLIKWRPQWILHQVLLRTCPHAAWDYYYRDLKSSISKATAILSVGGDNYSLDYGIPNTYIALDNYMSRRGKPLIIWGASIGPFDTNKAFAPFMHEHLKKNVKAIFVREERSLAYLKKHDIVDNVYLAPDPAFVMSPVPCSANELGFEKIDGAIGLNLSPLISRFVDHDGKKHFRDTAIKLIGTMQKEFNRPIILISHVVTPHDNDYELLSDVYTSLIAKNDVYLLPLGLNAAKTKWVISRLDCLIAARTHATIAAYSTGVPTIALAYSVKAYGINEMLFGHNEYVISPDEFSLEKIVNKVRIALENRKEINEKLTIRMQTIKNEAMNAGVMLHELIGI